MGGMMLTIRSAAQIRGTRSLKGFRSCPTSTGVPVQREVLDSQIYLLRLDGQLNVVAYGLSDDVARKVKER
jgi:hypothetical protein